MLFLINSYPTELLLTHFKKTCLHAACDLSTLVFLQPAAYLSCHKLFFSPMLDTRRRWRNFISTKLCDHSILHFLWVVKAFPLRCTHACIQLQDLWWILAKIIKSDLDLKDCTIVLTRFLLNAGFLHSAPWKSTGIQIPGFIYLFFPLPYRPQSHLFTLKITWFIAQYYFQVFLNWISLWILIC